MQGAERDGAALAAGHRFAGSTARGVRHQGEAVVLALDVEGGGADALLLEQGVQQGRHTLAFRGGVDGLGQADGVESLVVEDIE
ncbi:hypothetical protein D3C78_1660730 [compost metagenome]